MLANAEVSVLPIVSADLNYYYLFTLHYNLLLRAEQDAARLGVVKKH